MNIYVIFLFNFFINGILVFATAWGLVELFIFIFRIKNFRFKYFARLIPIIKVFIDLAFYNFSSWAIFQNINPLLCEKGTRSLTISFGIFHKLGRFFTIIFHMKRMKNNITFTMSDMLSH